MYSDISVKIVYSIGNRFILYLFEATEMGRKESNCPFKAILAVGWKKEWGELHNAWSGWVRVSILQSINREADEIVIWMGG